MTEPVTREEFDALTLRIEALELGTVRRTTPRPNLGLDHLHDRLLVPPDPERLEEWPVLPEEPLQPPEPDE